MEHWHGFETAGNVVQIYETTIADTASDLSAHFVTVPARSLGGSSYLYQGSDWPLETLGLLRIADVPFGSVARSWPMPAPDNVEDSCEGSNSLKTDQHSTSTAQALRVLRTSRSPWSFLRATFALGRFPGQT